MAACCTSVQMDPADPRPVRVVGGIQTRAYGYKAIGLLIHQMAALQKRFNKYLVKLSKCSVGV